MIGKFQVAANAIISRDDGKILILKRSSDYDHSPDKWDTVSGRLNQHINKVEEELRREIWEELGSDFRCKIIAPFSTYNFYRGGNKENELVGIEYIVKHVGGTIKLSEEHSEYMWVNPEKFIEMDIPESQKEGIRRYLQVKGKFIE